MVNTLKTVPAFQPQSFDQSLGPRLEVADLPSSLARDEGVSLRFQLSALGIHNLGQVYRNLPVPALVEHAVRRQEGQLADNGALVVDTGKYTGRSPQDRLVVYEPTSHHEVDWNHVNVPLPETNFERIYQKVLTIGKGVISTYLMAMSGLILTTDLGYALSMNWLFKICLPISMMSLPMHGAANIDDRGHTALFVGLSGTGKTTLSADSNRRLIGDDEHGWSAEGIFNFEGGCYAKTIHLSQEHEPQIWAAIQWAPCWKMWC